MRTTSESKWGTSARRAGTCKPHEARSADAATARRMVDFPAMLGPVRRVTPSTRTSFDTAASRDIQNGKSPSAVHGVAASSAERSAAGRQSRATALVACSEIAVATTLNVAAPTKSPTCAPRSSAKVLSASATARPARALATRYASVAASTLGVDQRSAISFPHRSTGCARSTGADADPSASRIPVVLASFASAAGRYRSHSALLRWSCSR